MRVQLIGIESEEDEYDDLLDTEGELNQVEGLTYLPDNCGDILTLAVKKVEERGQNTVVWTKLGNKFIFRKIPN